MKEITIKFKSEEDYISFINEVIIPSVEENQIEFDQENNIAIVNEINKDG